MTHTTQTPDGRTIQIEQVGEIAKEKIRLAVLAAMDEALAEWGATVTDADLPQFFRGLDAQTERSLGRARSDGLLAHTWQEVAA